MSRRTATTLTEVLMAIFIMALGLMSLLALFPMGALQMAQALKDQRAAEVAGSSVGTFRVNWKRSVEASKVPQYRFGLLPPLPTSNNPPTPTNYETGVESFVYALDNVNAAQRYANTNGYLTPATDVPAAPMAPATQMPPQLTTQTTASYLVYLDPVGFQANAANPARRWWVAGTSTVPTDPTSTPAAFIPRRSLDALAMEARSPYRSLELLRTCYLLDDLTFNTDGQPDINTPRGARYSWAILMRRDTNAIRERLNRVFVVVYSSRSADIGSGETAYPPPGNKTLSTIFFPGTNRVTVQYDATSGKPAIRNGTWVLDAYDTSPTPTNPARHVGIFYRVVNVEDSGTQLDLELQRNVRDRSGVTSPGILMVLDNVAEVFEKLPIDANSAPSWR